MFGSRRQREREEAAWAEWDRIRDMADGAAQNFELLTAEAKDKLATLDDRIVRIEQALNGTLGAEIQRAGYRIGP